MSIKLILAYLMFILLGWYVILRKDIIRLLIRKQKFKCTRCGNCCKLIVNLDDKEISRLKSKTKIDFVQYIKKKPYIMRKNEYCMFLAMNKGKARCTIYNDRPEICKTFPRKYSFGKPCWDSRCCAFKKPKIFEYI